MRRLSPARSALMTRGHRVIVTRVYPRGSVFLSLAAARPAHRSGPPKHNGGRRRQGRPGTESEPHQAPEYAQDEELGNDDHRDADGELLRDAEAREKQVVQLLAQADTVDRDRNVGEDRYSHKDQ